MNQPFHDVIGRAGSSQINATGPRRGRELPLQPETDKPVLGPLKQVGVSVLTLSQMLNLSTRVVATLSTTGIVVKMARGQYDAVASVRNYLAKKLDKNFSEKDRLTKAQADLAELKLSEARKELVPSDQVLVEWAGIVRDATAAMLGVTAKVQGRIGHLSNHDAAVIDSEIRAALTALGEESTNE